MFKFNDVTDLQIAVEQGVAIDNCLVDILCISRKSNRRCGGNQLDRSLPGKIRHIEGVNIFLQVEKPHFGRGQPVKSGQLESDLVPPFCYFIDDFQSGKPLLKIKVFVLFVESELKLTGMADPGPLGIVGDQGFFRIHLQITFSYGIRIIEGCDLSQRRGWLNVVAVSQTKEERRGALGNHGGLRSSVP